MSYTLVHPTIHNVNVLLNRITPYMDHGSDFSEVVALVEENGGSRQLGIACAEQLGFRAPAKGHIAKFILDRAAACPA